MLDYVFWAVIGLVVLVMLVALWRNVSAVTMILSEGLSSGTRLPAPFIYKGLRAVCAIGLGYWLYLILPVADLPAWGWLVIAASAVAVTTFFSNRLIYLHSTWQSSVQEVLAADPDAADNPRSNARQALGQGLESWSMRLEDCIVPDDAAYAGQDLAHLAIPSRFGCSVIEVERNGYVITRTGPDLRVYPGDKLLLLGKDEGLAAARTWIQGDKKTAGTAAEEFSGSILQTHTVPAGLHSGRTLAELQIARETGVRVVGIQRGDTQIINPDGNQVLRTGDGLLVVGTLDELRSFRRWLRGGGETMPPFPVGKPA